MASVEFFELSSVNPVVDELDEEQKSQHPPRLWSLRREVVSVRLLRFLDHTPSPPWLPECTFQDAQLRIDRYD